MSNLGNQGLGDIVLGLEATESSSSYAHAQTQADIKQTYSASAQAQADIKAIGRGFGQTQADIKQTYYGSGQAQADIKNTYFGLGQTQADIKAVGYGLGQAQADIFATSYQFGQAQALLGAIYLQSGQAQADIKAVVSSCGQAQADIKQTYFGLGQSQGDILNTYYGLAQAQADIKNTYNSHAQSQADIKSTSNGHGQSQALIRIISNGHGQAQGDIKQTSYGHGQSQALISAGTKNVYGQAQGTITAQYIHFLDTFTRTINPVSNRANFGEPDFGTYGSSVFVDPSGEIDGSKVTTSLNASIVDILLRAAIDVEATSSLTLSMDIYSDDYDLTFLDGYFELSVQDAPFTGGWFVYWYNGDFYLDVPGSAPSVPFTPVNGHSYRVVLTVNGTNLQAKAKIWDLATNEPTAWTLETTASSAQKNMSVLFDFEFLGPLTGNIWMDNLSVYSPEVPSLFKLAQAQALIITSLRSSFGQAKADIKATINKHAQAQAFIRKQAGYGQARAQIVRTQFKHGQAQALVWNYAGYGQAQATINTTRPTGYSQAWILNTDFPVGQSQAHIIQKQHRLLAQAQGEIKYPEGEMFGLAMAFVYRPQAYGQAQAFLSAEVKSGQAQAEVKAINRAHANARSYIYKPYVHGQAIAQITGRGRGYGNAQAYILRQSGYGQCQGYIGDKTITYKHGQSRAVIVNVTIINGQAQAFIRKRLALGQCQARIYAFGSKGYGQAEAKVLAKAIIQPYGQAQAYIRRSVGSGQAQGFIAGGRYLVKYNNHQLPGYAQYESYTSIESLEPQVASYADGSLTEYVGLQNKIISLRMKVVADTYLGVKDQVQEAATIMLSSRKFTKLYIQRSDRYYEAVGAKISMEQDVDNSMKMIEYNVDFHAHPWLMSDTIHTITLAGAGTLDTNSVSRTFSNGGWTPAKIIISGTNVTVSGYTATGDFTGFVSVSGTVSSLEIDAVTYTATQAGINLNSAMKNPDYAIYVGPGRTFFVITGATSTEISWQDRWYL